MGIDSTLKLLSLIFTNTVTKFDLYEKDIDIKNTPIDNYSISLYDLVLFFNNAYLSFKEEYNNLKKLNIGEKVTPLFYKDNELVLSVKYPTVVDDDLAILHIIREDDKIKCTINNAVYNNKLYNKELNIDENLLKKHIDLFEKYNYLLRLYNEILNGFSMSDGTYSLSTLINKDSIIDDINNIKFTININPYKTPKTRFDISVKIGDTIKIDENDSKFMVSDKFINADASEFMYILKNIYISKMYVSMINDNLSKGKSK